jgi:serine/threonine protein kinase
MEIALVGLTLAHYRVSAAIGTGGMSEVHKATDRKLGREVALKWLAPNWPAIQNGWHRSSARLVRLQLSTSSIVTSYSVEESDGIHFLTLELIEESRSTD